ncbi:MAG: hypothetical protein WCK51_05095 [Armatimonadota bacterium]
MILPLIGASAKKYRPEPARLVSDKINVVPLSTWTVATFDSEDSNGRVVSISAMRLLVTTKFPATPPRSVSNKTGSEM